MTELIVALDQNPRLSWELYERLVDHGVTWFKMRSRSFWQLDGHALARHIVYSGKNLMLDAKDYDSRDSIAGDGPVAFGELGARFLTVHATPSMLKAAMAAKTDEQQKVIGVGLLTDGSGRADDDSCIDQADGWVCSVAGTKLLREYKTILVCPGIRPMTSSSAIVGAHVNPATPAEARAVGADYVVVGRPIYQAEDPIAAAIAIMEELKG